MTVRLAALVALTLARVAYADFEGWLIADSRLPVYRRDDGRHQISLRVQIDFRGAVRAGGLQQALARFGMTWEPASWLMIGAQTNANITTDDGVAYKSEFRQELEATLSVPLSSLLTFIHRERFEVRFQSSAIVPRHRLLFRFNLTLDAPVFPFIWDELMLVPPPSYINQNRLAGGVVWRARKNLSVEVGYLWRIRSIGPLSFTHDHGPRIAISFNPSFESEAPPEMGTE